MNGCAFDYFAQPLHVHIFRVTQRISILVKESSPDKRGLVENVHVQ